MDGKSNLADLGEVSIIYSRYSVRKKDIAKTKSDGV